MSRLGGRALLAAAVLAGAGLVPSAAFAAWSAPVQLVAPGSSDLLPTQLAQDTAGNTAAAFSAEDVDTPGSAQAYLVVRSAQGAVGPADAIPGAGQILALAYTAHGLELMTGASPAGQDCCSAASVLEVSTGGAVRRTQPLTNQLTGAAEGALVPLAKGQVLALVAGQGGLWTYQSSSGGRFGSGHRLLGADNDPVAAAAAGLGGESSLVTWSAAGGPAGSADPRTVAYALGSKAGAPSQTRSLVRLAAGHRVTELGAGARGSTGTIAWIDSYYDRALNYHAQVNAADVSAKPGIHAFSTAGGAASGLTLASDPAGAQALAWKACGANGYCTVRVATRGPKGSFSAARSLGAIDATETPSAAISPTGQAVIGWIRGGQPCAAVGRAGGSLGPTRTLSSSVYALDLTVSYGARGAVAAWTQGTLSSSVVAASYR